MVDVNRGVDVSDAFRSPTGDVDLLNGTGLDSVTARRLLRCTAADLQTSSHHDEVVRRLAGIDQQVLWHHADVCESTQRGLRTAAVIAGSEPEDAEAAEVIEERHAVLVSAQHDQERVRKLSFFVATFSALGAAPLSMLEGSQMAMPFILFAAVAAVTSIVFWNRVRRASNAERRGARGRRACRRTWASTWTGSTPCWPTTGPAGSCWRRPTCTGPPAATGSSWSAAR